MSSHRYQHGVLKIESSETFFKNSLVTEASFTTLHWNHYYKCSERYTYMDVC